VDRRLPGDRLPRARGVAAQAGAFLPVGLATALVLAVVLAGAAFAVFFFAGVPDEMVLAITVSSADLSGFLAFVVTGVLPQRHANVKHMVLPGRLRRAVRGPTR
jgi:hypothetical protein